MMTDRKIIKALEYCCGSIQNDCRDCPFGERCENDESLLKYSLDLINRMDAEIERLLPFGCQVEVSDKIEQEIKHEAYREFAELVKEKLVYKGRNTKHGDFKWNNITSYDIDTTLKELTGKITIWRVAL